MLYELNFPSNSKPRGITLDWYGESSLIYDLFRQLHREDFIYSKDDQRISR